MLVGWEGAVALLAVQGNVQVMALAGLRLVICPGCCSQGCLVLSGQWTFFLCRKISVGGFCVPT